MPSLSQHVDCCGICHVTGFGIGPKPQQEKLLVDVDEKIKRSRIKTAGGEGRLMELTLTDQQLRRMPVLVKGLKKRGFKLVSRFLNTNSGNYVNVLHLRPHNRLHGSPYWKED